MENLTPKQIEFCHQYLLDFNATDARSRAGYSGSRETHAVEASKLLRNPKIQAYLMELRQAVSERTQISLERTMQEIARIAFSDVTDVLEFDHAGVKLKADMSPDSTAAIASIKSRENPKGQISYSLRMHDKMAALSLLGDYFGIKDDFNKARATLKRYGLMLFPDESVPCGWRIEGIPPSQ